MVLCALIDRFVIKKRSERLWVVNICRIKYAFNLAMNMIGHTQTYSKSFYQAKPDKCVDHV